MNEVYYVYWMHEPSHTDPLCEGYVGITKRDILTRFKEHKKHKDLTDDVVIEILDTQNTIDKVKYVEFWYRPEKFIGWNAAIGGMAGMPDGPRSDITKQRIRIARLGIPHEESRKTKISESLTADKHPNFGKRGEEATAYGYNHTKEHKQKMSNIMTGDYNPSSKHMLNPGEESLFQMYVINKMSFLEMGDMLGVSNNTVKTWCKKANIPLRTHSENQKIQSKKKRAAEAALVKES